ncbi:MAG: S-layer homology domain-containing protein [Armatimonadota bacterium]|nr:S-layer homology domain-containing protein [Armatimonadota bacterium]
MNKALCAIGLIVVMLLASPVLAQGPFTDVPTDHWAYDAVDQLVKDGIIVGYPDGTFGGQRAMTRFEFAQAVARAIPVIVSMVPGGPGGVSVTPEQLKALETRVETLEKAPKSDLTKADLDAIRKLSEEFRDELAALGVDVDALKRDVADLNRRVTAIEQQLERVKITGVATTFGFGDDTDSGTVIDRDEQELNGDSDLLENLFVGRDFDLGIVGKVADKAIVTVDINAGNYLNYIGFVDDYVGGTRLTSAEDAFFPYYMNVEAPLLGGSITVGRLPIQWGPYVLRKIDVDSYTVNAKTDSGDYPVDGIKGAWKFGGVGLEAVAAKVNDNDFLFNGLTSQPTAGLYNDFALIGVPFHDAGGHAMGGLETIDQFAGVRLTIGTPMNGKLGLSYIEAASSDTTGFDSAKLMAADLNLQVGSFLVGAAWSETDTEATVGSDIDTDNTALDANIGVELGKLGIKAGWKSIEHNFAAPGFWDKLGRWTNPTNVEGAYVDLKYGLGANLNLVAAAEFLSGKNDVGTLPVEIDEEDDDIKYYTAGLKWGMGASTSIDLGLEWVKWEPLGGAETDEKYINIGLGYQFNPNMGAKLGYQIVDFDTDAGGHTYGADYEGNIAVAQFSVKF